MLFRNPASDITASAMARVKTIVIEWFAERRHLIDTLLVNVDGLDEIPRHARRQDREVKELFGPHEFSRQHYDLEWTMASKQDMVLPPDALLQQAYWS